jgi:aspartyl-tRNA(Asn)/glutamyl-tRNA(Gln) amidotransferase subunit B
VRYLGVCDGNMEEGSLRADANVSINTPGSGLGKKVEIKNLNSSRFVRLALDHEIIRQAEALDSGKTIIQETRLWNENRDQTESMRSKENAHDYRYFPEPDLPVFHPDAEFLSSLDSSLVELPFGREKRFMDEYGLSQSQAFQVCEERELADYFETAVTVAVAHGLGKNDAAARLIAWISSDLRRIMNRDGFSPARMGSFPCSPERLARLVVLVELNRISAKNAKQTLEILLAEDADPETVIKEKGWDLITDPAAIDQAVARVCSEEASTVAEVQAAKESGDGKRCATLAAYLVGKVLKATDGRADPALVRPRVDFVLGL